MRADLAVRFGALADAACLAALGAQVWLHTYARSGIRPTIARYIHEHLSPAAFRRQLERSDAFTLVAEVDGHLVGYAISELGKPCCARSPALTHLDKLYVQEYFVGTGIGRALLTEVRAEASRRAASAALWLTVNSQNQDARAFYARQGFIDIGGTNFDLYGEQHENRILHALDA
jgi:ribosomal protein S18 acetylase RimI-like enzyme